MSPATAGKAVVLALGASAGGGTGTITGGTSLGGTEPIFGTNTAPTINFKGLTAGTGISLSSSSSAITVTNTGPTLSQIGPGFYGITVGQTNNLNTFKNINTLKFNASQFYVDRSEGANRDEVKVSLHATLTDYLAELLLLPETIDARIGPAFYGITAVQSDGLRGYKNLNILSFESANFYLTRSVTDLDKVQINLRPSAATGSGTITGGTALGGSEAVFAGTVAPNLTFKGLTAGTGISLGSSSSAITITNTGPTLAQIGPGFYGITAIQSNGLRGYNGLNVLSFEAANFYLTRSATDTDKVQINLRPSAAGGGAGTITGGTSLGGTEAVYGTTTAPTINFKGLTAGSGISLSSDANAVTITNTGSAGGGRNTFYVTNTINFQFDYPVNQSYFLDSYSFEAYSVEQVNVVTTSGQASVGFYIRSTALAGDSRRPGISIQGLDPLDITRATASRSAVTASATGNNAVPLGAELIMSVFYLSQNPKGIRGSMRIRTVHGA
jgi:hypothetical protein